MNILASKQVDILMFTINLGLFISPIVFTINNIQAEIFGWKNAKSMINTGLLINILVAAVYFIAIQVPPSVNYANQQAFQTVLGSTTRITIASVTAYYIGLLINSKLIVVLKPKYEKHLFARIIGSSFIAQVFDNSIFMILAFAGVLPSLAILTMIIGGTIIEIVAEIVLYPATRVFIKKLKES
jgi:uncharacterized integral membrane protein (TIGR00697 family)